MNRVGYFNVCSVAFGQHGLRSILSPTPGHIALFRHAHDWQNQAIGGTSHSATTEQKGCPIETGYRSRIAERNTEGQVTWDMD
jgi:hypothetical protein